MIERFAATSPVCLTCGARVLTNDGPICELWRLGPRNRNTRKSPKRIGVRVGSGTALQPTNCPRRRNDSNSVTDVRSLFRNIKNK